MSEVDRRTFLKGLAVASVTAAGVATPARANAKEARKSGQDPRASLWKKAQCPLCDVGCTLLVGIEKGRAVAAKGDLDSPVNRGLACAKGYHAIQSLYGHDRITRAQVRRDGTLVTVPLAEALDIVAQRLREATQQHGAESVALYQSATASITDCYLGAKLFGSAIKSPHVVSSAHLENASTQGAVSTFGLPGSIGTFEDLDHADVFVLWNCNMAETDPVLFSRILERRRVNNAVRIIELTTRATRTSYATDQSMPYRPGMDIALANAICHAIVQTRDWNREFVSRHVAFRKADTARTIAPGRSLSVTNGSESNWDEYVEFLRAYQPDLVQRTSTVPGDWLAWIATLYTNPSLKVVTIWGDAVNRQAYGAEANNALYNLHLLTGKLGTPGNAALSLSCSSGVPAIASRQQQRDAIATFDAFQRGAVRFLWVQESNPFLELPNAGHYRRAARQSDRFVVASSAYPTATTDVADVVLPVALWLERSGVYTNAERRLQYVGATVAAPDDSSTPAWQFLEIARRLQFSNGFAFERETHIERIYEEMVGTQGAGLPSLQSLQDTVGAQWPASGSRAVARRFIADSDSSVDSKQGNYDFYGHADHRAWIWLREQPSDTVTQTREYPMLLETGTVLEHSAGGDITRRIPVLHRAVPRAYVELHQDDARRLGIRNGQRVRVVSARGALTAEARINYRSQPVAGRVFIPWFDESVPVMSLMSDVRNAHSGQADLMRCAVRLEVDTSAAGAS